MIKVNTNRLHESRNSINGVPNHVSTRTPNDSTRSPHIHPTISSNDTDPSSNFQYWPDNILDLIKNVIKTPCEEPEKPRFSFEMTEEAAAKNFCVLKSYNLDLEAALEDH